MKEPKKRGRPKGSKSKVIVEDKDSNIALCNDLIRVHKKLLVVSSKIDTTYKEQLKNLTPEEEQQLISKDGRKGKALLHHNYLEDIVKINDNLRKNFQTITGIEIDPNSENQMNKIKEMPFVELQKMFLKQENEEKN